MARPRHTGHDVNRRLREAGSKVQIANPDDYAGSDKKVGFICELGHVYLTTPQVALSELCGCPECRRLSQFRLPESFTDELFIRNIVMDAESFTGMRQPAKFHCTKCNHDWTATPNNIVNGGRGCPQCSKSGFKSDKPATVYLMRFVVNGVEFLKYGKTNSTKSRYAKHKSQGMREVICERRFEVGHEATSLECQIKQNLGSCYVTKEQLPDGHTETLPLHLLEDVRALLV